MAEPSLAARIRAARARVALDRKMNRSSSEEVLELASTHIPAPASSSVDASKTSHDTSAAAAEAMAALPGSLFMSAEGTALRLSMHDQTRRLHGALRSAQQYSTVIHARTAAEQLAHTLEAPEATADEVRRRWTAFTEAMSEAGGTLSSSDVANTYAGLRLMMLDVLNRRP